MKNIGLIIILGFVALSCNQNPETSSAPHPDNQTDSIRDGLFIHITESYNDPHRVLMPLKMATMMSNDKDVLVYMDINSVELLVNGAEDLEHKDFDSFQTYLNQLIEEKVGIYACPTCLKAAGFNPEDLVEGVQIAQKDSFFNFTKGRILTLDY